MSNYPRDEFDRVPESSARQGVHRSGPGPAASRGLAPLIVAGVVVLLIGVAAYLLMPGGGQSGQTGQAASGASETSREEAIDDASRAAGETSSPDAASEGTGPTEETTGATPSGAASASPTPSSETAAIDKSTAVVVLNNTGVPGLAGEVTGGLSADGWNVTLTGNWSGRTQPSSVIFYDGQEQLANAQALAGQLGIDRLVDTSVLGQPLTIVLGPGFGSVPAQ
ncbi:LytR C-terminal domain-containing protein [Arthrobacter castelli]|uniref:LytR C-terminal domain-containing protein n=1 Tax=Arthrobacter castelli TaxID=271431 RepID=UPI000421E070|nr:LytR C-terminal domain-containing protein [Arthrobacter castelli]